MTKIVAFTIFFLQSIYTTLPAIMANTAPVLTRKINFLGYPLDHYITIGGIRILGDNKTYRGLISGVVFSVITISIQYATYKFTGFDYTLYNFEQVNFIALGSLMGFGVMFGDAFKSVIKRRMNIPPGHSFIPWDQLDCVIGGLLFGRIVWNFPIAYGVLIIITTFFLHILFRQVGYLLGICEKW